MISIIALIVSMVALAVCLLVSIGGILSDGLKGLKKREKTILVTFSIYAVAFFVFLILK